MEPDRLFAALAHPLRLRMLLLLLAEGELCVCELTHAMGAAQPMVSRHLAQMREVGLVQDRRAGLWIHYRLHPDLPQWARDALAAVADGLGRSEPHRSDRAALATMGNRPEGRAACCS
ncbi:MAG: metalloregulator ArsR/SmtB family transcription factor [Chromatiales bacterium]|jgi:ArsR family transcriptional regulator|nr:metalloregulator ArsR/SmtB family transcription factor [Chromatiales bacterium]MDX9766855.1 metalloregulator ArsR/SmtB family transcription factor [Ectothiorhodospiraceae bacterium]